MFLLPIWLAKGKAHFKQQIADRVDLDVTLLPYNEALLKYLRSEKATGRRLILATASNVRCAEQIALNLGLFDDVLASDAKINLSGHRKCDRLIAEFGERGFDYAGNDSVDLPIWERASAAILVDSSPRLAKRVRAVTPVAHVFTSPRPNIKTYFKTIRLHQWLKNVLVFVPVLTAHEWGNLAMLMQAVVAFLAFSLCASSVYVLNDLFDLQSDRSHSSKRYRAFAAGTIPLQHGLVMALLLLGAAFGLALMLPPLFIAVLGLYYAITIAYSLRLKQVVLIDVLVLAGLYTLRVIGGGAATVVELSFWLLAFSMFLFLSLALVKRYSELLLVLAQEKKVAAGRGYQVGDLETLAQFGVGSGYAAVLVLALYINSAEVGMLYHHPERLWLICPLLLYWISRVWLLARRDAMHEDPVVFAIKDRHSYLLFAVMAGIVWGAS